VSRHSLRITERTDATGVVVYDWTCNCAFAFGFWCATEDEAKAAAAHHTPPQESRHATEAERRAQPQISIVSSKKA